MAEQLELNFETADSPQGDGPASTTSQLVAEPRSLPKSEVGSSNAPPAVSMEDVADKRNLLRAFERVASNKGAPGPNRQTIDDVRKHISMIVERLHADLLEGTYRPGNIRRVWIAKAGGGERGLGIPDVIDRIVQQAMHQVLSPMYEPTFHPSSHGFRPDRSCHTAIAEAQSYVSNGRHWVVDIDIEKFFDTVSHDRLMARLATHIDDRRILSVIRLLLRAKVVMPNGVVVNTEEGTPQGGPLSPLLSNIVLDELDHELARRGHRFVRYADDCNVYTHSRRAAERVMASITRFIEGRLRLKVNRAKSAVAQPRERHFLGFTIWQSRVIPSSRTRERLATRVRELTPRTWGQSIKVCISAINAYLRGWVGFFGVCDHLGGIAHHTDGHLRRRLRAILWTQWKKRITKVRRLWELGVPEPLARRAACGRGGCWRKSRTKAICRGLTNDFFASLGFVGIKDLLRTSRPMLPVAEHSA